jgi:hypothetical protein
MRRSVLPLLLVCGALPLGGCAASIAASAVGAAIQAADKPDPVPTSDPGPAAREACTAEAGKHGEVTIIDTEYRSASRLIVWGRVQGPAQRRSFECRWDGKIVDFKLRDIRPAGQ